MNLMAILSCIVGLSWALGRGALPRSLRGFHQAAKMWIQSQVISLHVVVVSRLGHITMLMGDAHMEPAAPTL